MTRSEITKKVREVIALNSNYKFDDIKVDDPLDKFISSFMKDRLGRQISNKFDRVKSTPLTNQLYDVIKTVKALVDYIDKIYNPTA